MLRYPGLQEMIYMWTTLYLLYLFWLDDWQCQGLLTSPVSPGLVRFGPSIVWRLQRELLGVWARHVALTSQNTDKEELPTTCLSVALWPSPGGDLTLDRVDHGGHTGDSGDTRDSGDTYGETLLHYQKEKWENTKQELANQGEGRYHTWVFVVLKYCSRW